MIPWRNFKRFFNKALKDPTYAFKVFLKRSRAYFYYYLGDGRSSYPEAITFFLTHKCNLHCKMCGQWGEGGVTKKQGAQYIGQNLSLNELKAIIDEICFFEPSITLFGGEPLLYPDCLELIKYIKQKKMHCLMITNGSMLVDLAESIIDTKLDELNVSLDGHRDLHDQIRGMDGLFDEIMRGLKKINHFKAQKNQKKPFINLQCTISKHNYQYLDQLVSVADEANADSLTFHNLIFLDRNLLEKQKQYDKLLGCTSSYWEGFIFEPEIDAELLYKKIKQILGGKYRFSVDFYPKFSYQGLIKYYNPSYQPKEYTSGCLSPWMVAYVFPDGEVRPCLNFDYSYGNITNGFIKLWNNERAINFRRLLKQCKIFPVCARCTELYRY